MTTKATHSPGKWQIGSTDAFGDLIITNGEYPVAEAYFEQGWVPTRNGKAKRLPVRANARLIAAAPALLSAAQEMLNWWDGNVPMIGPSLESSVTKLREAVAGATGGQA